MYKFMWVWQIKEFIKPLSGTPIYIMHIQAVSNTKMKRMPTLSAWISLGGATTAMCWMSAALQGIACEEIVLCYNHALYD
jgi:hypothetical protein